MSPTNAVSYYTTFVGLYPCVLTGVTDMIPIMVIRSAALYAARVAVSAGIGVLVAKQVTKAAEAVHTEYKMYREYRASVNKKGRK